MNDPIAILLAEHRDIMSDVDVLRRALAGLRAPGGSALPDLIPALRQVSRMMAGRLTLHARKEDEALFAVLEEVLGAGAGPAEAMREEHRAIHQRAKQFRAIVQELEEVEHPAIVEAGGRLGEMLRSGGDAADLAETGERIVELLDLHFEKEEQALFPMAREILDASRMAEVAVRMEAIERDFVASSDR